MLPMEQSITMLNKIVNIQAIVLIHYLKEKYLNFYVVIKGPRQKSLKWKFSTKIPPEAFVHRCPSKLVFLKISQYLQENISVGVSF